MRVLCFGLDGADYDLVRDLLAQGKLPTRSKLSRDGAFGPLRSTIPPLTPVAWSSFLTGLNPGGHGIFGFSANPQRAVMRLESAANRAGAPLWRILGAAGIRYGNDIQGLGASSPRKCRFGPRQRPLGA